MCFNDIIDLLGLPVKFKELIIAIKYFFIVVEGNVVRLSKMLRSYSYYRKSRITLVMFQLSSFEGLFFSFLE